MAARRRHRQGARRPQGDAHPGGRRLPHHAHGPGALVAAQVPGRHPLLRARDPRGRQRRRARPHRGRRLARTALGPAVQPGAVAPEPRDPGRHGRHPVRRGRTGRGAHRAGPADPPRHAGQRRRRPRRSRHPRERHRRQRDLATPTPPHIRASTSTPPSAWSSPPPPGSSSPSPVSPPRDREGSRPTAPTSPASEGAPVSVGDLLGTVGTAEVRTPFAGMVVGFLAHSRRTRRRGRAHRLAARAGRRRVSPTGAVITGWGIGPARPRRHQRGPRGTTRHHRRMDRDALGHPRTTHRGHGVVVGHRGRAGGPSSAPRSPRTGRPARAGHMHPRPGRAGHLGRRAPRARTVGRRLRRQRGLCRVRLRAGRRPRRHQRRGGPAGPAHRRRLRVASHRSRRPGHGGALRRRRRGGRARGQRRGRPARGRPRGRRQRPRSSHLPPRWLHGHGGERGLPSRRADHGRVGHQRPRTGQAHARRHRPVRPPPGQPADHRGRRLPSGDPHGARGRRRRPDGEHLERLDPSGAGRRRRLGRLRPGDNVLMSGFGAGMAWASTVVRWTAEAPSVPVRPAAAKGAR